MSLKWSFTGLAGLSRGQSWDAHIEVCVRRMRSVLRDALFSSSYLKVRKDVQQGGSTLLRSF